jgi:hypothetical protein
MTNYEDQSTPFLGTTFIILPPLSASDRICDRCEYQQASTECLAGPEPDSIIYDANSFSTPILRQTFPFLHTISSKILRPRGATNFKKTKKLQTAINPIQNTTTLLRLSRDPLSTISFSVIFASINIAVASCLPGSPDIFRQLGNDIDDYSTPLFSLRPHPSLSFLSPFKAPLAGKGKKKDGTSSFPFSASASEPISCPPKKNVPDDDTYANHIDEPK